MHSKIVSIHYRIVDPALGFAKAIDEGDTLAELMTSDFDLTAHQLEEIRLKIGAEYSFDDPENTSKVVFTNISVICDLELLNADDDTAIAVEQIIKTLDGDLIAPNYSEAAFL